MIASKSRPFFWKHRWMDDLLLHVLLNYISVISGQLKGDNEMLCAMKTFATEIIPALSES